MAYRFMLIILLLTLVGCAEEQTVDAPTAPTTVPIGAAQAATAAPPAEQTPAPAPTSQPVDAATPAASATDIPQAPAAQATEVIAPADTLALPEGFGISVYQSKLKGPRMLALGPDNQIYVAERAAGRIVRLPDADGNGLSDQIDVVVEGLDSPSSVIFDRNGDMLVATTTQVIRYTQTNNGYNNPTVIIDDLPSGGHSTRTLLLSPDQETLYVSVGSSCNVCDEADPRRAAIVAYDPDGTNERIYAEGLRNAVGITLRPGTAEVWATNNGRDMLGDDQPPETVYLVDQPGLDFGWPRCHSGRISDPQFGSEAACEGVVDPVVEMQAHSAPLGLAFSQGVATAFPPPYDNGLYVAFHGSWNRTVPTGYKIVFIPLEGSEPGPVQDFAAGWLKNDGTVWGRPVDLLFGADGALYVSDDSSGFIYRIFAQ